MKRKVYVLKRCKWWEFFKRYYTNLLIKSGHIIVWIYRDKDFYKKKHK